MKEQNIKKNKEELKGKERGEGNQINQGSITTNEENYVRQELKDKKILKKKY